MFALENWEFIILYTHDSSFKLGVKFRRHFINSATASLNLLNYREYLTLILEIATKPHFSRLRINCNSVCFCAPGCYLYFLSFLINTKVVLSFISIIESCGVWKFSCRTLWICLMTISCRTWSAFLAGFHIEQWPL